MTAIRTPGGPGEESKFSVHEFGATGDGTTDDTTAIQDGIDALEAHGGGILRVPSGTYKVTATLTMSSSSAPVVIQGDSSGVFGTAGAVLDVDAGVTAIEILSQRTGIRGLTITGNDTAADTNQGVILSGHGSFIDNCTISSFGSHGIHILSGDTGDPFTVGSRNANCWHMSQVRVFDNYANGIHVEGVDSNAGYCQNLDCTGNALFGVYCQSAFGNVWDGLHFDGNGSGAIRIGERSDFNRFNGVYKEPNGGLALQIDAPYSGTDGGHNIVDFRYLSVPDETGGGGGIVDNSGSEDNVIITPGGRGTGANRYMGQNRLIIGRAGTGYPAIRIQENGATSGFIRFSGDTDLYRGGTSCLAVNNSVSFYGNRSAASAVNQSLFVDTADGKLKFKDSGGTTNALY